MRDGAEVSQRGFDDLDEAVEAMREAALAIRSRGPVKEAKLVRTFKAADQVRARLQISGRGLRKPIAGVDVRGDGAFVPFRGGIGRSELDPSDYKTPFDAVRETLRERR